MIGLIRASAPTERAFNAWRSFWQNLWQDDSELAPKRIGAAFVGMAVVLGGLLAACGGTTTIESALKPSRIIVFGDGLSDLGQVGGMRYSVNDGTNFNWTERVASQYALSVTSVVSGGLSYATGNARVAQKPDAAGNASTLTIKEQIDRFLAGDRFRDGDVILMSAGVADVLSNYRTLGATAAGTAATVQAARDYADQIRRVVNAGGKYVVVTGAYDLGLTPWGQASGNVVYLSEAVRLYDERLVVDIVGLGNNVLYLDGRSYFGGMFSSPGSFGLANSTVPACNSIDAGAGIGTGLGQVNSALCNTSTLIVTTSTVVVTTTVAPGSATATLTATVAYNALVFADGVYLTPGAQAVFGNYAYGRLANRW